MASLTRSVAAAQRNSSGSELVNLQAALLPRPPRVWEADRVLLRHRPPKSLHECGDKRTANSILREQTLFRISQRHRSAPPPALCLTFLTPRAVKMHESITSRHAKSSLAAPRRAAKRASANFLRSSQAESERIARGTEVLESVTHSVSWRKWAKKPQEKEMKALERRHNCAAGVSWIRQLDIIAVRA